MRTVFLTGGTGAVGSHLLARLLADDATHVRLLLRARSRAHLEERLGQLLRFAGLAPAAPAVAGRLQAFAGDVSLPRMGLGAEDFARLAGEVTHVIHSAGNVKLNASLGEARRSAVEAARQVVEFVHACQDRGGFRKAEFVSTVGVAGRMRGLVPEGPLPAGRAFRNTYEAAKAEAEGLLLREMQAGLPATIHRPSMVVGDSRTGQVLHFQVFYHLSEFLAGKRTWGLVPDCGAVTLDLIPADYVAGALLIASEREETRGEILHLCSGSEEAPLANDLALRLHAWFSAQGQALPRLRRVPQAWFRRLLPVASRLGPLRHRRFLAALPQFLTYLDEEQRFDNRRSRALFAAAGLALPTVESYLPRIMDFYWRHSQRAGRGEGARQ